MEWLRAALKATTGKTIVFAHHRLDVKNDYGVKNPQPVRKLLEDSGKALSVFQGHSHKNDLKDINGIRYGTIRLMGIRKQVRYERR